MNKFLELNVNDHTEKKNGLTYLSWAWAWSEVIKIDPMATWEAIEFNGLPVVFFPDKTAMVKTVVTIQEHTKSCWLPVMDHRNKAIPNPNAFDINKAIVRCLTKTISMFGLGLYIYAGEDLPESEPQKVTPIVKPTAENPNEAPLEPEIKSWLEESAVWITSLVKDGSVKEALDYINEQALDDQQYTYMHAQMDSKTRSALKSFSQQLKAA